MWCEEEVSWSEEEGLGRHHSSRARGRGAPPKESKSYIHIYKKTIIETCLGCWASTFLGYGSYSVPAFKNEFMEMGSLR